MGRLRLAGVLNDWLENLFGVAWLLKRCCLRRSRALPLPPRQRLLRALLFKASAHQVTSSCSSLVGTSTGVDPPMPTANVPSVGVDCTDASDQSAGVDNSMTAAAQPSPEPPASAHPGSPVVSPRGQAPSDSSDDVPIARIRSRPPTRHTTAAASAPTPPSKRSRTPSDVTSSCPASKWARGSQGPGAREAAAPLCPCPTDLLCNAHSPKFVSKAASDLWPMYRKHPVLPERNMCELSFASSDSLPVLRDLGLLRISTMYTFYWPTVVREFYTNLSPDCSVPSSSWYHKVYVRGHIVELSPSRLNQVLDWSPPAFDTAFDAADVPDKASLASALIGGSVTSWPSSGLLRASVLTVKYFLLFKVLVNSLCPSSNVVKLSYDIAVLLFLLGAHRPVNLGRFIFDRMLQQAETPSSVASLPYPCLISLLVAAMSLCPLCKMLVFKLKYSCTLSSLKPR